MRFDMGNIEQLSPNHVCPAAPAGPTFGRLTAVLAENASHHFKELLRMLGPRWPTGKPENR